MRTSELVFIGIRGSVIALNRATGEQVWATHLKGYEFVNVVVEGGRILATAYGEAFCLDPLTGCQVWHNRLKGFGTGLAAIATEESGRSGGAAVVAAKHHSDEVAAAAAAASA